MMSQPVGSPCQDERGATDQKSVSEDGGAGMTNALAEADFVAANRRATYRRARQPIVAADSTALSSAYRASIARLIE